MRDTLKLNRFHVAFHRFGRDAVTRARTAMRTESDEFFGNEDRIDHG